MTTKAEFITVEFKVRVSRDVRSLDAVVQAVRKATLPLVALTLRRLQETRQREAGGRLGRREWRERTVLTALGEVKVEALKVRDRETGRSFSLLNALFGLGPWRQATPEVERALVADRVEGRSYRQVAQAVGRWLGRSLSGMAVWRLVQRLGGRRIAREAIEWAAVEAGEVAATGPPAHLYLEADEIHVKAQRSDATTHRVKIGLSYTGRERVEGRAKARWRLRGKDVYGGGEAGDTFGLNGYASLERRRGVSQAPAVLDLADTDAMLWGIRDVCFPDAVGQLDRAHRFRDFRSAAPNEGVARRWRARVCQGRLDLVRRNVRLHAESGRGNPELLDKVWRALHHEWIEGWKQYRDRLGPDHGERIPTATGGIEKNQEVLIGRAMKRRGMAWSAAGANHLVKLIIAYQDTELWENLWNGADPPFA